MITRLDETGVRGRARRAFERHFPLEDPALEPMQAKLRVEAPKVIICEQAMFFLVISVMHGYRRPGLLATAALTDT